MNDFNDFYKLMQRELILQGKAPKTQDCYLRTLRRIRDNLAKGLDELTPEDLKVYFAELLQTYSWSTAKADRAALMFFYHYVLKRDWVWIDILKPKRESKIPNILSQEEVFRLLSCVKKEQYRVCLASIYSMGLRLSEGLNIGTGDICKNRMRLHVRNSKGAKDRLVPMPESTYQVLRKFWVNHRNKKLLFPTLNSTPTAAKVMDRGGLQLAFRLAAEEANIPRHVCIHSLRHSYATHLLQSGVSLLLIQKILGHSSPVTTTIYVRISQVTETNCDKIIDKMMVDISSLF